MKYLSRFILSMFLIGLFTAGCQSSPQKITYNTLATVGATVDRSMGAAAAAKVQGKLTDAQWSAIAEKHSQYLVAYNAAVDLAATATTTGLSTPAPADLAALATDLINLVNTFTK